MTITSLEASDGSHRTFVGIDRSLISGQCRVAVASFLLDTRGFTEMTVPDEGDRSSTVEVDCFNSAKLDEKIGESLQVKTLLLGLNTVHDDEKKMAVLVPADGKARSEELDEALGNALLLSRGFDVALSVADKPATTLDELLEAGLLDEALVAVTGDVLAVVGDAEHDAAL